MTSILDSQLLQQVGIWKFGNDADRSFKGKAILTALNTLGYIPVVGIITGIANAVLGIVWACDGDIAAGLALAGRGLVQALGVGILFAPFDIGCTIARLFKKTTDTN